MEWDYSGRKGRDGQKKKISKANERKGKVKRGKDEEVNGQGGKRGAPAPHGAEHIHKNRHNSCYSSVINSTYYSTEPASFAQSVCWHINGHVTSYLHTRNAEGKTNHMQISYLERLSSRIPTTVSQQL